MATMITLPEASVEGPNGAPLTLGRLPPAGNNRWVARRKAEVLAAVRGGLLSRAEALRRYRISNEEFVLWERALDCAGLPGLRVTRVQVYRSLFDAKH